MKKQGLKNKNWKKRWFVLDHEKCMYFENQDKTQKPLGGFYLDEMTSVNLENEMSKDSTHFFSVSVPGRKLIMGVKSENGNESMQTVRTVVLLCSSLVFLFICLPSF